MYHPLLLRQIVKSGDQKLTLAFPNGIPGGWSSTRKIHFIGHSMGAQTVRYLQHLLSIDYFNKVNLIDSGLIEPKVRSGYNEPRFVYTDNISTHEAVQNIKPLDRSDWIASITSVQGDFNHSSIPLGFRQKLRGLFKQFFISEGGGFWSEFKYRLYHFTYVYSNLTAKGMSMNNNPDRIDHRINV